MLIRTRGVIQGPPGSGANDAVNRQVLPIRTNVACLEQLDHRFGNWTEIMGCNIAVAVKTLFDQILMKDSNLCVLVTDGKHGITHDLSF